MGHDRDPHNLDDLECKNFDVWNPLKNSFQTNIFSFDLDFEQLIKCHDIILYRHAEKGVGTNHFSVHLQQLILKYKIQQLVAVMPPLTPNISFFYQNFYLLSTVVHLSLASSLISGLNQSSWQSLGCLSRLRRKLGTENFGVAWVVAPLPHHIVSKLTK